MKKVVLISVVFLLQFSVVFGQSDPISLEYNIGEFRIDTKNNQRLSDRFKQLDPNRTYVVTIVGSADFLGSEDNNINLSNKRVKFAEYHLLQHFGNLRLIVKLDSKGEMQPVNQPLTTSGIQEHRTVHIYVDDYGPTDDEIARNSSDNSEANIGAPTTVVTKGAVRAELLREVASTVPLSSDKNNGGASTDIEQPTAISAVPTPPVQNNTTETSSANNSGRLKLIAEEPMRSFDGEGTYQIGDKLLLSDMNFRPGSHYLRPSSIPTLRKLIQVMADNPKLRIEIRGHICCHPNNSPYDDGFDRDAGNNTLSFNRANNIKDYLEKNEIDGSRITAVGMGAKERLVYPEETDEDRTTNRRVEVIITSN